MAGLLGGSLCTLPCRGTWNTTQLGACTHREHAYTGVHTLGKLLDHAYLEQGCWCPGPCPVPPMCGALRAASMMAPPASMALGTAQHGRVPFVGTRWMGTNPAVPEAAWLNPSLPQKSQIPALGSPLPSVCVEGGFASSPPLLRYFGAVCPALVFCCYSGGGGGNVQQDGECCGSCLASCCGFCHLRAGRRTVGASFGQGPGQRLDCGCPGSAGYGALS